MYNLTVLILVTQAVFMEQDKPRFQIRAHEEHQFLYGKDPDGKDKSPFSDFKYKPEELKDKDK